MIFPKTQDKIQQKFYERYQSFLEHFLTLHETIKLFVESARLENPIDRVIFFLLIEIIEDFNGVIILCKSGLSRNSMKILRSQFEHSVTLAYLQKNQDETSLFINWYDINQHKIFLRFEEAFPQCLKEAHYLEKKEEVEKKYKTTKELYIDKSKELCEECKTNVCKNCKKKFGKETTRNLWSKDIISMAREAGISAKSTYFAYAIPLTEAHPSYHSINRRVNVLENSIEHNPVDPKEESQILLHSHYLLIQSLQTFSKHFLSEDEVLFSKLQLLENSFSSIWKAYLDLE